MKIYRFLACICLCFIQFQTFSQELITNGNFETGNLTAWTSSITGDQILVVNDGSYTSTTSCFNYLNPTNSQPPIDGNYSLLFDMFGGGTNEVTNTVTLPSTLNNLILSFEVEYGREENVSAIEVELLDNSSTLIEKVYTSFDNDAETQLPTQCISLNLSNSLASYAGQNISIRIALNMGEACIPTQIDNVSLMNTADYDWVNGQSAFRVIGQADFTTGIPNAGGSVSNNAFTFANDIAIDHVNNKMYVSDYSNHRVLRFAYPPSSNQPNAEAVFGQVDFTSSTSDDGANGMDEPAGICVDPLGNLWVADSENHRILRFDDAANKSSGADADGVLGQVDFTSSTSGTTAAKFDAPFDVFVDRNNILWLADRSNNRILRFDDAANKADGADADGVLGQFGFTSDSDGTNSDEIFGPISVYVDVNENLWVADSDNNRILRFDDAANKANGADADGVLGQSSFTDNTPGTTASKFTLPTGVTGDAQGNIYTVDAINNRLLIFMNASNDPSVSSASFVLGQLDFTSSSAATTANGLGIGFFAQAFFDTKEKVLWLSDASNNRVLGYNPAQQGADYFVKTDGNDANDGQSWASAFATVQKAIETAQEGETIWVAQGTYYPTKDQNGNSTLSKNLTFYIEKDLNIYGGFNGDELVLSQRVLDFENNASILSGDIGIQGDASDNSYHVVFTAALSSGFFFDGFIIQEGNGNSGSIINKRGGGWYNDGGNNGSSTRISNCIFFNNTAESGGAMHNNGSNGGEVNATYVNCQFIGNQNTGSFREGGAVLISTSTASNTSDISFENCVFSGNGGPNTEGGAIGFRSSSNASPTLVISNCSFANNEASDGTSLYVRATTNTSVEVRNSIVWSGEEFDEENTFIDEIAGENLSGNPITVSYSIYNGASIDGILTFPMGVVDGGNNIGENPLYVDDDGADELVGTLDDNLLTSVFSPSYDNGNSSFVSTSEDLAGNKRIDGTAVDMGAYELACRPIFVDADATSGNNDGSSWANAFLLLEDAIDTISNCNTKVIWVAEGTYYPTEICGGLDPRNKSFCFFSDIEVYGGFNATENSLTARDLSAKYETILSGDIGVQGDDSDNAYTVVRTRTKNVRIDGFTITKGNNNSSFPRSGGLIAGFKSAEFNNHIYSNCTFKENSGGQGGAFYNQTVPDEGGFQEGIIDLINCVFYDNESTEGGAGAYIRAAASGILTMNIVNCTFNGNTDTGNPQNADAIQIIPDNPGSFITNIQNTILWNEGTPLVNETGTNTTTTLTNSILKDGTEDDNVLIPANVTDGGNNGDGNPIFVRPSVCDFRLGNCSPAINFGNNTFINGTSIDAVGNLRIFDNTVDAGALEAQVTIDRLDVNTIVSADSIIQGVDSIITIAMVDILASDTIIFEATEIVLLTAGFHAQSGSDFTARINDCDAENSSATPVVEVRPEEETATNTIHNQVSSTQEIHELQVGVFPNPFSSETTIKLHLAKASRLELIITDMNGQIVHQQQYLNAQSGWQQYQFNASHLPNGMYFLHIRNAEQQVVKQLVVQK